MRGWLIYRQQDADKNHLFIQWLQSEAVTINIELTLVIYEELTYGVEAGKLFVYWKEGDDPDFVIMRAIDPLLSQQLEWINIPVFNSAQVAAIANDKAKTHQLFARHGIPMMDTHFAARPHDISYPLIIKDVTGRGGEQVSKIRSKQDMPDLTDGNYILQQMAMPGKDVRVFVLGNMIIGSVLRTSESDFRANYSLGGTATLYELSTAEHALVHQIIDVIQADFIGIDFVFGRDGTLYLNEIEDIVGSRTLTSLTDINIAQLYMTYIKKQLLAKD
ncbi:ATP-grasp domain-containing protein [Gracilibacillus caseinilyticus]|uniref:ATP-grasp domain-containing protein n=1 Tax=Gracilibacillus caseinilyticus TaxID=2932256 RepID=A0ABY4EYC5_9BACI|nr:ATP-grasp domain-containing protein [Gracilibacillus caseinilyticus]UOQ48897.1 ATP-grasp domain-containing protein [Gracilibacillus caseinilyticus]